MYKRVIIILADGARPDVLDDELCAGRLPNIARHLVEGGSKLAAVTGFPSTTGPAFLPFLTGCLPGTCNVPGIRWFDKQRYDAGWSFDRYRSYVGLESFCMGSDIKAGIRTIFELVPDSYSIFNPIARGAKGKRNVTRISRIWHWYYGHLTDHWSFTDDAALAKLKNTISRAPKFVFVNFPGIDTYSHLTHPRHESVIARYRWLDCAIGEVVEKFRSRGEWETTAIFLVSDHGLSQTHTHFCVNEFLEKRSLPPFFYPLIFEKKGKLSANMISGNGMTHLYFKNRDGWGRHTVREELLRISPGIIDALLAEDAVDIVACRDAGGSVCVSSRRGGAKLRLEGEKLFYEVKGSDPFGYVSHPGACDASVSLAETFDTEYPDAPFQIAHLLSAERSGDLVISATPGFDLRVKYEHPEHKSTHGSLHRQHMRVPLISNVRLNARPARTVDVFATALKLLGREIPENIDGTALV